MKRILTPLIAMFIVTLTSHAQDCPPAIEWQNSFGGSASDKANYAIQTTDGGYALACFSNSNDYDVTGNHGSNDQWIVKLDGSGVLQWQKCFGSTGDERASFIQQTTDGGFIVAGSSNGDGDNVSGNHGDFDYWIVKITSSGEFDWGKCLGGSLADRATCVQQTSDGGYIVCGYTGSSDDDVSLNHGSDDYWVVKLTSAGDIDWEKSYGGGDVDRGQYIRQTSDGGFIVAGFSSSFDGDVTDHIGGEDYWIVKLNADGTINWQKSYGGGANDEAYAALENSDGEFIVAGLSFSTDGDVTDHHGGSDFQDYWIVKLDASGNAIWKKSVGGTKRDGCQGANLTTDGGIILAGNSSSIDGDLTGNYGATDYWVVKMNSAGELVWQKNYGGSNSDLGIPIQETADGGFIVAGQSSSNNDDVSGNHGAEDCWVAKLYPSPAMITFFADADADGYGSSSNTTLACSLPAGYTTDSTDCNDVDLNVHPNAVEIANNGIDDDCDGLVDEIVDIQLISASVYDVSVFPNPTNGAFVIDLKVSDEGNADAKIEVLNMLGQIIISEKVAVDQGKLQREIQLSNATAGGMYLVKVTINDCVYTAQISFQK